MKSVGKSPPVGKSGLKLNRLQSLPVSTPGRNSWCDLGTITRNKPETKEARTGAQRCQIDVENHMAPYKNRAGGSGRRD